MTTKRSPVEGELYQQIKHLHHVSEETLEQVVAGEQINTSGGSRWDVTFPTDSGEDLL